MQKVVCAFWCENPLKYYLWQCKILINLFLKDILELTNTVSKIALKGPNQLTVYVA